MGIRPNAFRIEQGHRLDVDSVECDLEESLEMKRMAGQNTGMCGLSLSSLCCIFTNACSF